MKLLNDVLAFVRSRAKAPRSKGWAGRTAPSTVAADDTSLAGGSASSGTSDTDALLERRNLLGLFEQAPGFVTYLRGPEHVFELANEAYYQLIGRRDVVGKSVADALPEVSGQGFVELLHRVYQSGEAFIGHGVKLQLQRTADGPLRDAYVDFVYQPIRGQDNEVRGIMVQGHDVTELKHQEAQREQAEVALRESEERYRTLFDSIDDGFCLMQMIVDATGKTIDYRFLETNAAFEGQTGLVQAIGKTALELIPNLDSSWFELYGGVADTGVSARFENHAEAMDSRWFDVYASRVGRPELRLVALVFKDITERKRIEREREQLLASESAARREAEQASRLKDDFLATVSHELRTPLNAMLGWVHLLRAGNLSPEKRPRALETIERNARAQAQLIEDLLDVSRILSGTLRLQVESVDMASVVETALDTVRPAAQAKAITLQATLPSGTVNGDPHRLQQVVWNLLSNAVKFTPRGGRVQVSLAARDGNVELRVSDTGRGIELAFQPYVFERFRQQEGGPSRSYGGLGLGLSIVRQLVELHGGSVSVFSEGADRGATFTVLLRQATLDTTAVASPTPSIETPARASRPDSAQLAGLDVLVVDDEDDAREMVRHVLESSGASVRVASSVAEALAELDTARPGLLVSDIGMPEEDGYMLIERVRQRRAADGGDVPAIALTAYARSQDRTRALRAGFQQHVTKPVDPLELLAVIGALLGLAPPADG